MSRRLHVLVVAALLLSVPALPAMALEAVVSNYTTVAPVIDGDLDEAWSQAEVQQMFPEAEGLSGTLRSLWSEDAIYFFVEVKGDGVVLADGLPATPWRADSMEISMAFPTLWKLFTYQVGGEQFAEVARGPGNPAIKVAESYMKQVDGGWVAEVKVYANSTGALEQFKPAEGVTGYTVAVRANVMVNGTRVYFDNPPELQPNSAPTFAPLELRK